MPCDPELLSQINFFELLDDDDRRALAEVIDRLDLEEGQTLFEVGEPGCELYVVRTGSIELYVRDTTGQKIVVHAARMGDMFGELALLDDEPRSATAVAAEPASLLVLDRGDLSLLFQKQPDAALAMLASMSAMTRKADRLLQTRVSRNANEEAAEQLGILQKIADWLAWFSGSMPFLLSHTVWFAVWISLNTFILPKNADGTRGFDPFPFGLLTMIVSLEAIFLACFVLISQNRQAQKDKVRSDIEYEVNIKAELEVAHLHEKTDRIQETMLARFNRLEHALGQPTSTIEGDSSGVRG
ncbi:MAG: family transcriptional regulator, cyclic receptor protein [Acidobacteriota bacterium]|nr:family transcriptional regulator, cyclic receptor protein [Acidobacteriota bacterium]